MWRIVELAAKYDIPFQIHTGQARIQGSNPMLLVDLIEANPNTKFILFHGGYPWVGETGVIAMKYTQNVWVDSCWLPTLSYAMAKGAYHEWLDVIPSNKIMWGADAVHAEGVTEDRAHAPVPGRSSGGADRSRLPPDRIVAALRNAEAYEKLASG